ncbi:hypothetical protein KKG48_03325 [Patescibacteria group bacterium]|nr:hypothetical protein [Patescibacteria group bacterium]MCG2695100.1 hypothetical protein [Candidatus Parcubacteria bacterium]
MEKITKTINNISYFERKLFWVFLAFLVSFAILYGYFVNQTILNIVERKGMEDKIVVLESEISEFEFDYITLKNNTNLDYAYSVGFKNVSDIKFASRRLPSQGLSVNLPN